MALRAATFAALIGSAAAGACSDDEANVLGDAYNTGEQADACGHKAYSIISGFNHDKFNECFTAAMGISQQCSECYAVTGEYGAKNCKGGCISGWCKGSCLSCTQPAQDSLGDCTGFTPTPAQPCDGPSPPPTPGPPVWGQTITPSSNTDLCLDVPADSAFDGNNLWLWECNGGESQLWLFDNWQIRFAADESKCIDAGDMSNGLQLYLWDCNGSPQQTWGYDGDMATVYLADTSTCLDYYGDWASSGQPLHIWECSGDWNQQWSIWDQGQSRLSAVASACEFTGNWRTELGDEYSLEAYGVVGYKRNDGLVYSLTDGKLQDPRGQVGTIQDHCYVIGWSNGGTWVRTNDDEESDLADAIPDVEEVDEEFDEEFDEEHDDEESDLADAISNVEDDDEEYDDEAFDRLVWL